MKPNKDILDSTQLNCWYVVLLKGWDLGGIEFPVYLIKINQCFIREIWIYFNLITLFIKMSHIIHSFTYLCNLVKYVSIIIHSHDQSIY